MNNPGPGALTGIALTFSTGPFTRSGGTCTGTLTALAGSCTIIVAFHPTAAGPFNATLTVAASRPVIGSPVALSGIAVPPPTLTSISPTSGTRGNSVVVTLNGTNFANTGRTPTVAVSGSGVSVSGVTVQGPTAITATLTITATATLSARNVTVTTGGGTATLTNAFTVVNPPAPTLTSISPTTGTHGTSVKVTLTGTNFTSTGTTLSFSGTGVTAPASGISVQSPTTLTATVNITNGAARTARTVRVTTPGGTSPTTTTVTLTVN